MVPESMDFDDPKSTVIPLPDNLILTLGSGTSGARKENLKPLFDTNITLICGKYGLRNHF